jgi:hypothetical protein
MFKLEESKLEDFIDKSLDIFLLISQNITRSNLSKQAFISIFHNEYFIEEIISLLNNYLDMDPQEFEAHLTLIFEILMCVFSDSNRNTDIILIEYGNTLHETLSKLKIKMQNIYDNTENDPVNKDFFNKFENLINFLAPTKIFTENKDVKSLMTYVNDCLFNNLQKYNLNEKPINEDNLKEENIREYVKGLKLNILHYENLDVDYLDTLKKKNSLINELLVAVKIINLSVITIFNYLNKKLFLIMSVFRATNQEIYLGFFPTKIYYSLISFLNDSLLIDLKPLSKFYLN